MSELSNVIHKNIEGFENRWWVKIIRMGQMKMMREVDFDLIWDEATVMRVEAKETGGRLKIDFEWENSPRTYLEGFYFTWNFC